MGAKRRVNQLESDCESFTFSLLGKQVYLHMELNHEKMLPKELFQEEMHHPYKLQVGAIE